MGEYIGYFVIENERNGEIVGQSKKIDLEEYCLSPEGIEQIDEDIGILINQYEDTYA